jgi:hypothetical protein
MLDSVSSNRFVNVRIFNSTASATYYEMGPPGTAGERISAAAAQASVGGFVTLTFGATTAQTFKIQFASSDNISTVGIQYAYLEFYRIL